MISQLMNTLEWSHPMQLNTKRGPRLLKKSPIGKAFWSVYRESPDKYKEVFRSVGIVMSKFRNEWELAWWSDDQLKFKPIPADKPEEVEPELDFSSLPPLLYPEGLLEYQLTSVQMGVRSMNLYNRVLLGHSTGVGKTFCALGIARELGKRVAVICPLAIRSDWFRAAKHMGVEAYEVTGWEYCKTGKSKIGCWVEEEKKNFKFDIPEDTILIFDEVHRARAAGTSQNSYLVRDSVVQNIPTIALSATIADDPIKLWAMGQFLGLHCGGKDFFKFIQANGCTKTRFGFQFRGSNNILKKLHHRIYPDRGNRLRHSDLGDAFPETTILARAFDMESTKEIANEYDDLMNRVEELRTQENFSANILAAQTHARQKIELLKAPAVASLTKDLLDEGHSVFIAVSFRETMEFLKKELKTECTIHGGQSELERRGNIDSFQRDKNRVIIGVSQACQEGLNLHDLHGNHPRVALIFPQPSSYTLKQVLGRVHRAGGVTKSLQWIVYSAGVEIEEKTCRSLDGKLKRMDLLNDAITDPSINLSIPDKKDIEHSLK